MRGPAIAGISAVAIGLVTVTWVGLATPGHDPIHGYVSTLGIRGAPYRTWYILGGTVTAVLNLWFIKGLAARLRPTAPSAFAITALVVFFILQWLGAAVFPCDPGCAWLTPTGQFHYTLGLTSFVAFALGIIGFELVLRSQHIWSPARQRGIHIAAGASIAAALVLLAADRIGRYHGLAERLTLVAFGAWTVLLALSLAVPGFTPQTDLATDAPAE